MRFTSEKYVGPVSFLKGKTAIVRPAGKGLPGLVRVQFDDIANFSHLAFGWHVFPKSHFIEEDE